MTEALGYASPPSSVDDHEELEEAEHVIDQPTESAAGQSDNDEAHNTAENVESNETVVKRGRGRPRKYPPGVGPIEQPRPKKAAQDQQFVVNVKEYSFRSRREKRSLSPDSSRENDYYPARGLLRAQLEQDEEFAAMPGRSLTGLIVPMKAAPVPYDGPKRPRGRPKKIVAAEETLTLD